MALFDIIRADMRQSVGQDLSEMMQIELTQFLGREPIERSDVQSPTSIWEIWHCIKEDSMGIVESTKSYLEAFDGNATWDSIQPLFDEVMHPELKVVTADGILTRDEWEQAVRGMLARGMQASEIQIRADQDGTIFYQLAATMSDGTTLQPASKATAKDGKIIHIEPVDPAVYTDLKKLASS